MGQYAVAAALVGILTLTAALALRAPDGGQALLGLAAASGLALWFSAPGGPGAIAVLNPGWAVALLLDRRLSAAAVLPAWAAAAVAALAFGMLGAWLVDDLPQLLVQPEPELVPASAVLLLAGTLTAWAVTAAGTRRGIAAPLAAGAVLVAGTALPPVYCAAVNPAVLFGLGVAGVASWTYVYVGVLALLTGAVIGGLTAPLVVHDPG